MAMLLKHFTKETGRKVFFKKDFRRGVVLVENYFDADNPIYYVKWIDCTEEWCQKKHLIFLDELEGKKVRFINKAAAPEKLWCSPPVGTVGVVCGVTENGNIFVQWPMGTTYDDSKWWHVYTEVEIVEEDKERKEEYTNEEVWEFLKPKMEQRAKLYYYSPEVKDMIVSAYRSGYGRASKGRPFKIGEKK